MERQAAEWRKKITKRKQAHRQNTHIKKEQRDSQRLRIDSAQTELRQKIIIKKPNIICMA